jgi:hypothetical protein
VHIEKCKKPGFEDASICNFLIGSYRTALLFHIKQLKTESQDGGLLLTHCIKRLFARDNLVYVDHGFGHHNQWDLDYLGLELNPDQVVNAIELHDPFAPPDCYDQCGLKKQSLVVLEAIANQLKELTMIMRSLKGRQSLGNGATFATCPPPTHATSNTLGLGTSLTPSNLGTTNHTSPLPLVRLYRHGALILGMSYVYDSMPFLLF